MFVTVIVMQVMALFEIEVKKIVFIAKQFLGNECSITLETLENKIWICRKLSHLCTINEKDYLKYTSKPIKAKLYIAQNMWQ